MSKKFGQSPNFPLCNIVVTELTIAAGGSPNSQTHRPVHHPASQPFGTVRRGFTAAEVAIDGVKLGQHGRDFRLKNTILHSKNFKIPNPCPNSSPPTPTRPEAVSLARMEGDQSEGGEEDFDFSQSDIEMASEEDDMLDNLNVIDGIEIGMDINTVGQGEEVVLRGEMDEGKLVATRGKGTLSQGRREENQMQFMPTPTVARESPSRILEYGPASTFGR
ncbi:Hypothetical predicted protein [Olea europaea subsp. europaea]|uniref:Uncharacterized protein n=1 Tax=Olea europaea subsp. europaea TaxID=158383 RepID=A0A8S0S195_OLEEU|nr:Hypothetical predicted protein [Olea europaea subsp. europaea]